MSRHISHRFQTQAMSIRRVATCNTATNTQFHTACASIIKHGCIKVAAKGVQHQDCSFDAELTVCGE